MADVVLTPEAIEDILEIYGYILERDGKEQAESILGRLEGRVRALGALSLRGKFPEELVPFGNRKIREVQEAPWRIFYRPEGAQVFVLGVLDGRRTLREMLEQRLLS